MKSGLGWAGVALLAVSCSNTTNIEARVDPGALVKTSMNSKVGVLLDEVPPSIRDRVAQTLIAKPSSFWIARAREQIKLTTYRLVFRQYFYSASGIGAKQQLPLPPPEVQKVTLGGSARRETVNGHDYVLVDYAMNSVLVTTLNSPKEAETKLSAVGGVWTEPFILPIDPELLFQRTRFACVDEEDFPPNSVDAEEMDSFYDQACLVEKTLAGGQCHLTELPTQTCVEALDAKVGRVDTEAKFERIPYDATTATAYRVGRITNPTGPDLQLIEEEFRTNRVVYRYIPPTSCTVLEGCVGAPGWRRLLQFSTSDKNVGAKTLDIGAVDYYLSGKNGYVSDWGLFELNTCHQHYHFKHYGDFKYGPEIERKNGFCLQSTARVMNHEQGPLTNKYGGCGYQGVEASWADQYKAGLECQWVDVTTVDTTKRSITYPLSFTSNPDGFLCEGTPVLDAQGLPVWELTSFKTETGGAVYRQKCDYYPGYLDNNGHSYNVTLPLAGEGFVTLPCARGQLGPLRNCGMVPTAVNLDCTPGVMTTATCTAPVTATPQVARLCEYSAALKVGSACTHGDAVANGVVEGGTATLSFKCPSARDAMEPGGKVTLYTGAVFPDDANASVTCTVN